MTSLADRIQRASRLMAAEDYEALSIPPFVAFIDHVVALSYFSWAVPEDGARPPWGERPVADTISAFAAAGRQPRFEFVESCWPGLVDALMAGGFKLEQRLPGMTCETKSLTGGVGAAGISIERVGRDADGSAIAELLTVKWVPFGETEDVPTADAAAIERFRRTGMESVVARSADGIAVGSAGWFGVQEGVSEIVAVGVLPEFRRRGIAAALTAAAGRCAADEGADLLFVTPENMDAGRVYERAGFAVTDDCSVVKLAVPGPTGRRSARRPSGQ